MAISAGHLYWSNIGDNEAIWEANLDGSDPHPIVTGQDNPTGVAADGSHLYWATFGAIWEANLDGTSPHAIVTGLNYPSGVASDASHLYWASTDDGTVNQANPDGSSPHTIVTGQDSPSWMAVTPAAP